MSVEEKWFVKGTTAEDIINHEMGHVYENVHSISPTRVAKRFYETKNPAFIIVAVSDQISLYADKSKTGREILSEAFAGSYSKTSNNDVCLKIKAQGDKILKERGHQIKAED